jgi:hypothetical protein
MDNSKTVNRFPRGRVSTSNGFIDIDFGIDKHSSYSLQAPPNEWDSNSQQLVVIVQVVDFACF